MLGGLSVAWPPLSVRAADFALAFEDIAGWWAVLEYDSRLSVAGDLVVDDAGRVFVGSRTYELIALDTATGKELWKDYYWFSWIESPPVVGGQTVYTGSSDGVGVYAIDVATGARRWKARVPAWA